MISMDLGFGPRCQKMYRSSKRTGVALIPPSSSVARAVVPLMEAGHRCTTIPTCRSTPVDLVHIEPW
jgi:hypothetical protein